MIETQSMVVGDRHEIQITQPQLMSFDEMKKYSEQIASSKLMGKDSTPPQVFTLMMLCQAKGLHPVTALEQYDIIEGKAAMKSAAMMAKFQQAGGSVIWHVRNDSMAAATFFADKSKLDDNARQRAAQRFEALWFLEDEEGTEERTVLMVKLAKLSREGEETIIRTYEDADDKNLTKTYKWVDFDDKSKGKEWKTKHNWEQSPRQMLTWRVSSEGIRLIAPGIICGIYTPDEVEDIITHERNDRERFVQQALEAPQTREEKLAMMNDLLEKSKNASPEEKSALLGKRSELMCELADSDMDLSKKDPLQAELVAAEVAGKGPGLNATDVDVVDKGGNPWVDHKLKFVASSSFRGKTLGACTKPQIKMLWEKRGKPYLESDDAGLANEARQIKKAFEAHFPKKK